MADVEFQYLDAGSPVVRERFNFGQFPIMLKVLALTFCSEVSLWFLFLA